MRNSEKFYKLIEDKVIRGVPELQKHVENELIKEGRVPKNIFDKFKRESITIRFFDVSVLVWFAEALESFDTNICKVSNYFEDVEILNAKMYVYPIQDDLDDYLVFNDVVELSPNQFMCSATLAQLGFLSGADKIITNPEAQRNSIVKRFGDVLLRIVVVNKKRVNDLLNTVMSGRFYFNSIRLNLLKDSVTGEPVFNYNKNLRTITIDNDAIILNLDGNHRVKMCEIGVHEYPEQIDLFKTLKFSVLFTNETIYGCKAIVDQEWNREEVPKDHIKSMKRSDANWIVEILMSSETADPIYSKKIVRTHKEIKGGAGYILMPLVSDAIEYCYDKDQIKSMAGKQELKNWIEEFCNYVSYILYDDFENYLKLKDKKWSVLPEAWVFYIYLSSVFKNKDNWKEQLSDLFTKINWGIDTSPYKESHTVISKLIKISIEYYNGI